MDLPKNVTQIGEADARVKIYVEDYVVSFLKQLNPLARDKTMAAALYGRRKTEEDKTYLFVYGAGKLDFLQKETKRLSQAQQQEIERIRRQFFQEYEFLGYRILDGEMVDGFHVLDQDSCRFVSGYAQFYEKNEAMLSYMLESRQVEAAPEAVDSGKYDVVRNRQEKRRANFLQTTGEERDGEVRAGRRGLQASAAVLLILLLALGLALNSGALEERGISLDRLKAQFQERKLPELTAASGQNMQVQSLSMAELSESAAEENAGAQQAAESPEWTEVPKEEAPAEALKAEDKKADAISGEKTEKDEKSEAMTGEAGAARNSDALAEAARNSDALAEAARNSDAAAETENIVAATSTSVENAGQEQPEADSKEPTTYIVRRGDTLTGISLQNYGSEKYVSQICKLNSIQNPDEIQVGQKILLPQ